MRFFDAVPRRATMLLMFAFLPFTLAQVTPAPSTHPPTFPSDAGANSGDEQQQLMLRRLAAQAEVKRNEARQQQLVNDTARLLELAQQLKTEVDKTNKTTLSLTVVKKAEEIEKLAKSVKDRMRDSH